jgi:hypothetical protein
MIKSYLLTLAMLTCFCVSNAEAAVIQFYGSLTSKVGPTGVLQFALPKAFTAYLSVNDSGSNLATVAFGGFKFGNTEITVSGGSVEVKNGTDIEFLFDTSNTTLATFNGSANGTAGIAAIGFTFTGISGLGTGVNQSQLYKLDGATTNFTLFEFGGLPFYSGTITAIPEPSSLLALTGLVSGFGAWRLRRRAARQEA